MKILITENQFESIIKKCPEFVREQVIGLHEQTTGSTIPSSGTTQPLNLDFILSQSESGKTTNEFCKSKTGYDVCMFAQSNNTTALQGKYNTRKNILLKSGYTMVEEDKTKPGIITSIWKKT